MQIGIPKEAAVDETRVAIVPGVVAKLKRLGLEVIVEKNAGERGGYTDSAYKEKGAQLAQDVFACDIILSVDPPASEKLTAKHILVCMANPLQHPQRVLELAKSGVTCFSLELMPRISRAQSMDVLSSMANAAGYKAVVLAAAKINKIFPLMMTAAGTVPPAKVFVLGAGVAGLQAIATAKRLGAVVEAYDIRPDTKEQVQSLGARFIEFDLGTQDAQDARGYAKELTAEQKAKQAQLMAQQIQGADVVITTAQVPGKKAPLLIPEDVVKGMKPGAVIVDMAAETGGNCALSQAGKEVEKYGVIILGPKNLPGSLANSTSQLYANNLVSFLGQLIVKGEIKLNLEDQVIREPLICHKGEIVNQMIKELLG